MTSALKTSPVNQPGTSTLPDLLHTRAGLPADHPDRARLRERSIEAGLSLARGLANRYRGRGEPIDDLYQVAALALVKAVDAFDPERQVAFSSFATPTILGALKRHFRDHTWRMQVPRAIRDLAAGLGPVEAHLTQQLGRSPTLSELAAGLNSTSEEVAVAREAWRAYRPGSLDGLTVGGPARSRPLFDTLGVEDGRFDTLVDWHTVQPLIAALPHRERLILTLRFFEGLTQDEIAARVGLSQMHISRLLVRTLAQLRTSALMEPVPRSRPPMTDRGPHSLTVSPPRP